MAASVPFFALGTDLDNSTNIDSKDSWITCHPNTSRDTPLLLESGKMQLGSS
jgi:hypothetical protein